MSLFSIESHQIRGHFDPIMSLKYLKIYLGPELPTFKIKMQQIYSTSLC